MIRRIAAILRLRCPRCLRGRVYRSMWHMHGCCPECELQYGREQGYFFGAMFFSYGIGIVLALPTTILCMVYDVDQWIMLTTVAAQLAVFSPLLFRYSRVVWMHFDQLIDPR